MGALQSLSDVRLAENACSLEEFEQKSLIAVALDLLVPCPDLICADVFSSIRRPLLRESDNLFRAHKIGIFTSKSHVGQLLV